MNKKNYVLGIIGGGNMASAIINGILNAKIIRPNDIIVSDINEQQLDKIRKKGIFTTLSNDKLILESEYILLAIKPQMFHDIVPQMRQLDYNQKIISIMAGMTSKSILKLIDKDLPICRTMPNTPSMIAKGMTVINCNGYDDKSRRFVNDIFSAIGSVIEMQEKHFDAVTSLSGSGPAYVYEFINALIQGGVKGGLSETDSRKLAIETVIGATEMVKENFEKPLQELIDSVCSKGGTTIEAINSFRENHLKETIIKGMDACRKRSEELSYR